MVVNEICWYIEGLVDGFVYYFVQELDEFGDNNGLKKVEKLCCYVVVLQ